MLYCVETSKSLDQVTQDLHVAVVKRKFGVMAVHNLKETMHKKGVTFDRNVQVFEVCNPHQAKKVLEANPAISTALPCRIALYEEEGRCGTAMIKPTRLLGMFDDADLRSVAEEVEQLMIEMMDETAG